MFKLSQAVHKAEYSGLDTLVHPKSRRVVEPAHKLEVLLDEDTFTEEKYSLFKHYQMEVHKESADQISKHSFRRFLCSGMAHSRFTGDGPSRKIGSFHQCYRIDGRLVALGVLDLMPCAVSSVYFVLVLRF